MTSAKSLTKLAFPGGNPCNCKHRQYLLRHLFDNLIGTMKRTRQKVFAALICFFSL